MSNARFSILQAKAVEDKRISNSQFRTLAALGMYGDKEGYCFPHLKTLGEILGKSKQAVSKDLQALVNFGYIEINHQHREDGSQMGNLYRLLFDLPHQPDVDPHQWGIDTHQPQMLTPISSQVDPPSTSEVDALTPHINALNNEPLENSNGGEQSPPPKPTRKRDKLLDHPAIAGYKSIARLNVPIIWRGDVVNTVGDNEKEVYRWLTLIKSWIGKGYNCRNVEGMLDAFKKGGINLNGKSKKSKKPDRDPKSYVSGQFAEYIEH